MLRIIGLILMGIASSLESNSQSEPACSYQPRNDIQAQLIIKGSEKKKVISKSNDIPNEITISLSDTSYKVIAFITMVSCHSGIDKLTSFDVDTKTYYGNKIKANDPFINRVLIRDLLAFDCITIEKDGKISVVKGFEFPVIP